MHTRGNSRKQTFLTFLPMVLTFVMLNSVAMLADTINSDPATLQVGAIGTCPISCSGDPNIINQGTDLAIYQVSGGAGALVSPVLLIFGVPNNVGAPSVTGASLSGVGILPAPTAGSGAYNLDSGVGNGAGAEFQGLMAPTQNKNNPDVYGFLNVAGDNSENWTNWTAADSSLEGITGVTGYGIYVFSINLGTNTFGGKGLLDVTFSAPTGTFAAAWGCQTSTTCSSNPNPYTTAFTNTGMVNGKVPEPSTLLLLGTGLLGMIGLWRARKSEA